MRAERPEWFASRNPLTSDMDELLKLGCFLPLPDKNDNQLIVVIRTAAHNPKKHSQNNVFKCCKLLLDLVLYLDESVSIYGVTAIFDMANVTLGHALQLNPPLIRRSVQSWENYSCRPKVLEFVNAPVHVNVILNIFRSFMSSKMKSRLRITRGKSSVSPQLLPPELGGTGPSYRELTDYWLAKAREHRDWFLKMEQYKSIVN